VVRIYSPGASVYDDYAHICDQCEIDDGRATLSWGCSDGRYFDLCFDCVRTLEHKFIKQRVEVKVNGKTS